MDIMCYLAQKEKCFKLEIYNLSFLRPLTILEWKKYSFVVYLQLGGNLQMFLFSRSYFIDFHFISCL